MGSLWGRVGQHVMAGLVGRLWAPRRENRRHCMRKRALRATDMTQILASCTLPDWGTSSIGSETQCSHIHRRAAAVGHQHSTGHEGGTGTGQELDAACDLVGMRRAPQWQGFDEPGP